MLAVAAVATAAIPCLPAEAASAPAPYAERLDSRLASLAAAPSRVDGGRVRIEIATDTAETGDAVALLGRLGGAVDAAAPGVIEARVPAGALRRLGMSPLVRHAGVPLPLHPDAVGGEGVALTGAATAHRSGIRGKGVTVAVIDAGFAGYANSIASGDLPASVVPYDYCPDFAATDHGTQVAEVVHETAPAARLLLMCTNSGADLVLAEQAAAAAGAKVISRSLTSFNQTRGDGSGEAGTSDAVASQARADGILWINSAGNYALSHWMGAFADADGDANLDFVAGDEGNRVRIGAGQTDCVALKWDSWPVTAVDYDLYLVREADGVEVASSTGFQGGAQPPTEGLCYRNEGPSQSFDVVVNRFTPPGPTPRIDLFAPDAPNFEHRVPESSINETSGSPDVVSVGAFCRFSAAMQPYSSQGPTIDGRVRPDLSGPNPISTTIEPASDCLLTGFGGTSAAAPQVAGAAALYEQALGLGPPGLQRALETSAAIRDIGVPGKDNASGSGLLTVRLGPCAKRAATILGTPGADRLVGTRRADVFVALEGDDRVLGRGGGDRICGGDGNDRLAGGAGRDRLFGAAGYDRIKGGPGRDRVEHGSGKDKRR